MWRALVLALVAVGFLFLSSAAPNAAASPPNRLGDADCSGAVDPGDVVAVLVDDAGGDPAPCTALADVQCDGDIDARDALELLRFEAGLEPDQADGCGTIGEALDAPRSSYDLIEKALAEGDIDAETAILYEFYAAFDDPLLPDEYDGDDSGVTENPALHKLPGLWDSLSQQTRDLILPFLRTPPEPDSWYSQLASPSSAAIQWNTVSSASHPVKIWWETRFPADEARAQAFAAAIDSDIWSDVTQDVMGASPIPDCGAGCPSGGGDEKLDVYLVSDVPDANYTQWNPPDSPTCENTPAFITLLPSANPSTLTHEFMHAVQFALPYANGDGCDDTWWWEATATAVEDYVWRNQYNADQHSFAPAFLSTAHKPLEDESGQREYGAYLFPFYLDRVRDKPGLVGDIFAKMGTEADILKAIESMVAGAGLGDFGEVWRDFVLKNWNKEPVEDYKDLDSLAYGATPSTQQLRIGEIEIDDANVEHMAAIYAKFTVPPNVRTIVFSNTLAGVSHASVTAIKKVRGEWKDPEDWSDEPEKEFCRDRPSEDVSEIVIIIGNSDAIGKAALDADPPTIEGKAEGCSGFEGTVMAQGTGMGAAPGTSNGIYTMTTTQTLRFEQSDDSAYVYDLVAGAVRWTASGNRVDGCDGTISGEFNVDFASEFGIEWYGGGRIFLDPFNPDVHAVNIGTNRPPATEVWDCEPPNEGFSGNHPWFTRLDVIPNVFEARDVPLIGEPGSRVAQGSFTLTETYDFEQVTYSWHFTEYGPPD